MAVVFISYRREQTAGEARALFNALVSRLGKDSVFMDVDSIALGRDFRQVLHERLASCDHVLVLVGRDWADARTAAGQRRLEDPADFVRIEIETALKRSMPVTPVLVQNATMPDATQLPDGLRDFAYRNGFELSHSRWESDLQEMQKRLGIADLPDARDGRTLESALAQLPSYLPDLVHLVTRPKTSILRWTRGPNANLKRAVVFVTVSVAIGFVLQLPQLDKDHAFSSLAAGMAVFKVLALVSMAWLIHLMFRAARGRAAFAETLAAYLYICSPLYLVLVILETAAIGVLRSYDPTLAAAARLTGPGSLFASPEQVDLFSAKAPGLASAYMFLTLTSFVVIPAWFFACWGALRELHGVPRWRGAAAGAATLLAGMLLAWGLNYFLVGMFGSNLPPLR